MKLFPGCTVTSRLPFVESATRYVAENLGVDSSGTERMCCFEPTGLRSMDPGMWAAVGKEIHSRNESEDLVTLCEGCNISLTLSKGKIGNDGRTAEVNGLLEFLHDNIEEIKKRASVPVEGTFAVFPGCHGEYAYGTRGHDASAMMSEILEAVGCSSNTIKGPVCCGGGLQGVHDDIATEILQGAVDRFKEEGSGIAAVSCVFCFRRLDIAAKFPVMHISEIVARAMGWDADVSRYHRTKV